MPRTLTDYEEIIKMLRGAKSLAPVFLRIPRSTSQVEGFQKLLRLHNIDVHASVIHRELTFEQRAVIIRGVVKGEDRSAVYLAVDDYVFDPQVINRALHFEAELPKETLDDL